MGEKKDLHSLIASPRESVTSVDESRFLQVKSME